MIYQNDPEMITSPHKKDMDYFVIQMVVGSMFGLFTGGLFLSGYLIYLNAPDWLVSYATLIPNITGILVVFCANMIERQPRRRTMVVVLDVVSKGILVSVILIPLVADKRFAVPIVVFLLLAGYIVNSVNVMIVNTWFIKVIPNQIMGRYFSVRQIFSVIVAVIVPLASGWVVDMTPDKYYGFMIMYVCAVVVAALECVAFARISDPVFKQPDKPFSLRDLIVVPLKNKPFMAYTIRMCIFQFVWNMAMSFNQAYMLKYIQVSYTYINAVTMISYLLQIFVFYKFWGRVHDRLSANFTLTASMWFFAGDLLVWSMITPSTIFIMLPIGNVFGAIEGSGFAIASFTRRYELIPEEGRVVYDSFFAAAFGIMLLLAPIAGSFLRSFAEGIPLFHCVDYGYFRYVYLISFVLIVALQIGTIWTMKRKDPGCDSVRKSSYAQAFRILKEVLPRRG